MAWLKNRRMLIVVLSAALWLGSESAMADENTSSLHALASRNWRTREQAFTERYAAVISVSQTNHMINMPEGEEKRLISLMLQEAAFPTAPDAPADLTQTEGFSDYFADIIWVVSEFGTIEAAEALLDERILITGKMARDGVVAAGHPIVSSVLTRYDQAAKLPQSALQPGDGYALSLVMVMNDLLSQHVSDTDIEQIGQRLLVASNSTDAGERREATDGLGKLAKQGDPAAASRLIEMSVSDPSAVNIKGRSHYPVREQAAKEMAPVNIRKH